MKKYTLLVSAITVCLLVVTWGTVWALFEAPLRSNLMLDLTASGGIKDLSLGQRFIQVFGDVAPKTDSGTTDPYINFAGSGQLASTLGWNANDSAPFTISFWAKAPTIARINDTPMMMDCANYESGARFFETTDIPRIPNAPAIPPSMYWSQTIWQMRDPTYYNLFTSGCYKFYYNVMSYQIPDNEKPIMSILSYSLPYRKFSDTKVSIANTLPQTLFSFQRVNNFNADLGLKLTKDYQCQLEGTGATFDCTKFQDSDWHLITLRRNTYKTLDVMIDTNVIVSYKDYNWTTSRNVSIGQSSIWSESVYSRFKGGIRGFRIYNIDLTDAQIKSLSTEFVLKAIPSDLPLININQPSTAQSSSKQISATTSTGVLTIATTTGDICNDTLTFDTYIDLTFSSVNDNFIKVCYRAVNGATKVYKLSDPIIGITGESSAFNVDNVFWGGGTYKSWPTSARLKNGDYTRAILITVPGTNFVDINGDWLTDILYNSGRDWFLWIFANNWDYTFRSAYKCQMWGIAMYDLSKNQYYFPNGPYYGDCADTNYR